MNDKRPIAVALSATVATAAICGLSLSTPSRHQSQPAQTAGAALPEEIPQSAEVGASSAPPPAPRSAREVDGQDAYNHTRSFTEYMRRQQHERPAFAHLPFRDNEAQIQITNVTSDGRLVLQITPLGLNVNPRTAYERFLRRYHDPGGAYLAEYGRYQ
jgi:hypothetical protein